MKKYFKVIVHAPIDHADRIREVLNGLGAGHIGNYDYATFSVRGIGRFRPLEGADPAIGSLGEIEEVPEERIEAIISARQEADLQKVYDKLRSAHPYEEPAIEIMPLIFPK